MQSFTAKQLDGQHTRTVVTGEELVLLRWMGEEHERIAIFVVSHGSVAGIHGPAYEATRDLFEASTDVVED